MKQYHAEVYDETEHRPVIRVYREPTGNEFRFDAGGFIFPAALEGHELTLSWSVQDAVTWVPLGESHSTRLKATAAALKRDLTNYVLQNFAPQKSLVEATAIPVDRSFKPLLGRTYSISFYEDGYPTRYFPPLTKQLLDAEVAHVEARWDRLRRRYGGKHYYGPYRAHQFEPADAKACVDYYLRLERRRRLRAIGAPYFAELDEANELLEAANAKKED